MNEIKLYYEVSGTGMPLLLLHGNGESHKIFDKAIPLLSERFTVYAIDSRGHGQSDAVSEYHYDDMAEDVKCFIDKLKLKNHILYGFSDGGIIGVLDVLKVVHQTDVVWHTEFSFVYSAKESAVYYCYNHEDIFNKVKE